MFSGVGSQCSTSTALSGVQNDRVVRPFLLFNRTNVTSAHRPSGNFTITRCVLSVDDSAAGREYPAAPRISPGILLSTLSVIARRSPSLTPLTDRLRLDQGQVFDGRPI